MSANPPAREHAQPRPSPYAVMGAAVGTVLLLYFLFSVAEVLLLLFIAALFAVYLSAITDFLEDRLRLPRGLGIVSALLITAAAVALVGWLVLPPVVAQTQALITALPAQIQILTGTLVDLGERYPLVKAVLPPEKITAQLSGIAENAGQFATGLFPFVFDTLHTFVNLASVFVMGIYMALRPQMYKEGAVSLAPPVHRELVRDILSDLGVSLRAWIGGQLIAMVCLGVLTWIGLLVLHVPFALAFGVFTGVVVMVPFFGSLVSTLLPALFVFGQGNMAHAMGVVLLGVVVHIIEGNFVHPMVMERRVHLPPVLTIMSVLVMAHLLGAFGLVVAVPVLATVMVITRRIYVHRLLEGKGFRRFVRDAASEVRVPESAVRMDPGPLSIPAILEQAGAAPR